MVGSRNTTTYERFKTELLNLKFQFYELKLNALDRVIEFRDCEALSDIGY